jgi:hypothetical protein
MLGTDRADAHIRTEEPGAGLERRNDRIRDCVGGERVKRRASFDWSSKNGRDGRIPLRSQLKEELKNRQKAEVD